MGICRLPNGLVSDWPRSPLTSILSPRRGEVDRIDARSDLTRRSELGRRASLEEERGG